MSAQFPSVWGPADFCNVVFFNSLHNKNDFSPLSLLTSLFLDLIFSPSSNERTKNFSHFHPRFFVLLFFSSLPLFRFLTKREQQLMHRRHHAEELLQWKERLDQEEAEVRRIEKEALAVWNKQQPQAEDIKTESPSHSLSHRQSLEPRPDSEKGEATEKEKCSQFGQQRIS